MQTSSRGVIWATTCSLVGFGIASMGAALPGGTASKLGILAAFLLVLRLALQREFVHRLFGRISSGASHDDIESADAETALRSRLRYEQCASECIAILSESGDLDERLKRVLANVRAAVGTDRAYMFENEEDPDTGLCMNQIHEDCGKGVSPQIDNPELQHLPYKATSPMLLPTLRKRRTYSRVLSETRGTERDIFVAQGIASILIVPIIAHDRFWGFVGFDDCHSPRRWHDNDVRVLQTLADSIGNAIIRQRALCDAQKFKTISDQAAQGNIITDMDGNLLYVNEAFAQVHGYTSQELTGHHYSLLHGKEYIEAIEDTAKTLKREGRFGPVEVWHRRKDGTDFPMLMSGTIVHDQDTNAPLYLATTAIDISGLRQAEAQLRLQGLVLDQIQDHVTVTDLDGRITYVNDTTVQAMGYSREELIGQSVMKYGDDPTHGTTQREIIDKTLHEGQWRGEVVNRTADGREIIMDTRTQLVRDENGKPVALCGIATDVTERRQSEEALRTALERLEAVFDTSMVGIMLLHNRVITKVNRRMGEMLGYAPEEMERHDPEKIHLSHRHFVEFGEKYYWRLAEQSVVQVEYPLRHRDGHAVWCLFNGRAIAPPDLGRGAVWVIDDISERKRAELALQESDSRNRAVLQAMPDLLFRFSKDGVFLDGHAGDPSRLLLPREAFIGKHCTEVLPPDIAAVNMEKIERTLETRALQEYEYTMDMNGGTAHFEARMVPLGDDEVLVIVRDVSHEAILQAQLRQSQKMEAVGQLAGGIAHDFNNLLQVIQGYGDLAKSETSPESPIWKSLSQILKASDRATLLVRQLLAFSRRQVLEMQDLDLNDTVSDLLTMLRRVIGEHIELHFKAGKNLAVVRADLGQIGQILTNLCVNARDAIAETSGTITIETANAELGEDFCKTHTWAKPGCYVLLSVADTGCGMNRQTLERVFEPFFTTKPVGQGTGLGLSTVYGLVKQHGGLIHIVSEVNQGSTFQIYLPPVKARPVTHDNPAPAPPPGGNETILVAEDDEMVQQLTVQVLESAGYRVLTAQDGEEALNVFSANSENIGLAILDVVMPKLGGHAVYERIADTHPHIPVIFASGYNMDAVHTDFILNEGLTLIQKPCERNELLRRIRETLDRRKTKAD